MAALLGMLGGGFPGGKGAGKGGGVPPAVLPPAVKGGKAKGKGEQTCPNSLIGYHVAARANVQGILKGGFKPGTNPRRCRIGKGIYFFVKKERAIGYAKKVNGKILTCCLHTRGKIFDTGEQDHFQAKWVFGNTGIGLGRHWPAMNSPIKFNEFVKRNPKTVTVLFVGKKKAKLPAGSVFQTSFNNIFSKWVTIKTKTLKCGARVDFI